MELRMKNVSLILICILFIILFVLSACGNNDTAILIKKD